MQQSWNAQQTDYGWQGLQQSWPVQQTGNAWQGQPPLSAHELFHNFTSVRLPQDIFMENSTGLPGFQNDLGNYDADVMFQQQRVKAPEIFSEELMQSEPQKPPKKAFRAIADIVYWVFCVVIVAGSILFATSGNPNKNYFGYRTYNVLTQSMTPKSDGSSPPGGFKAGDMILVKMCHPEEIAAGDIITFNPSANEEETTTYLTHRVVRVLDELNGNQGIFFVTKGDANPSEDPPIAGHQLIGKKVGSIPAVGGFLQTVRQNFIAAVSTVVCTFGLIIMLRWYFAKPADMTEQRGKEKKKTNGPGRMRTAQEAI
jgi:signal peptidase I